jgi:hypothetical protein
MEAYRTLWVLDGAIGATPNVCGINKHRFDRSSLLLNKVHINLDWIDLCKYITPVRTVMMISSSYLTARAAKQPVKFYSSFPDKRSYLNTTTFRQFL